MTPQERQLVEQLFDRLAKLEREPRDAEAERAICEGLTRAPNALYALVQTAILQDEALRRANDRIEEMEAALAGDRRPEEGGFLDKLRNSMFGGDERRGGSVPSVRPGDMERPDDRWSSRPMGAPAGFGRGAEGPAGGPSGGGYGGGYGGPGGPSAAAGGGAFGGGGSFLGTAAAAAAGAIGGSLLLNSIRNVMGPAHAGQSQGALDPGALGGDRSSPWGGGNAAGSDLARQAGADDIGTAAGGRQYGALDDSSRNASYDRGGARDAGRNEDDSDPGDDDSDLDYGDDGDFDTV